MSDPQRSNNPASNLPRWSVVLLLACILTLFAASALAIWIAWGIWEENQALQRKNTSLQIALETAVLQNAPGYPAVNSGTAAQARKTPETADAPGMPARKTPAAATATPPEKLNAPAPAKAPEAPDKAPAPEAVKKPDAAPKPVKAPEAVSKPEAASKPVSAPEAVKKPEEKSEPVKAPEAASAPTLPAQAPKTPAMAAVTPPAAEPEGPAFTPNWLTPYALRLAEFCVFTCEGEQPVFRVPARPSAGRQGSEIRQPSTPLPLKRPDSRENTAASASPAPANDAGKLKQAAPGSGETGGVQENAPVTPAPADIPAVPEVPPAATPVPEGAPASPPAPDAAPLASPAKAPAGSGETGGVQEDSPVTPAPAVVPAAPETPPAAKPATDDAGKRKTAHSLRRPGRTWTSLQVEDSGITFRISGNPLMKGHLEFLVNPSRCVLRLDDAWRVRGIRVPKGRLLANIRSAIQPDGSTSVVFDLNNPPRSWRLIQINPTTVELRLR